MPANAACAARVFISDLSDDCCVFGWIVRISMHVWRGGDVNKSQIKSKGLTDHCCSQGFSEYLAAAEWHPLDHQTILVQGPNCETHVRQSSALRPTILTYQIGLMIKNDKTRNRDNDMKPGAHGKTAVGQHLDGHGRHHRRVQRVHCGRPPAQSQLVTNPAADAGKRRDLDSRDKEQLRDDYQVPERCE